MGKKLLYTVSLALSLAVLTTDRTTVAAAPKPLGAPTSWTEKLSASVKSGTTKMTAIFSPKPKAPAEIESVGNKKPGPGIHVAIAQASERNGNLEEAEMQYQKALKLDPNHLGALVGYARLEDGRNNFDAATKLYHKAIKKHSQDASVRNDLGLCYHRHGMLAEATKSLEKAVEIQPARRLYRGNLAAVLVEQGKTDAALAQLTAAHGEAVGHYNLGYLLAQKKNNAAAIVHFQKAVEKDPSLEPARQWIARLSPAPKTGTIEPLPPTGVVVASRASTAAPPVTTSPPPAARNSAPATVRNSAPPTQGPIDVPPTLPAPAQRPKPADGFIRAEIGDSNSGDPTRNASSPTKSELHFLPSQNNTNRKNDESTSSDRSSGEGRPPATLSGRN